MVTHQLGRNRRTNGTTSSFLISGLSENLRKLFSKHDISVYFRHMLVHPKHKVNNTA